VDEPDLPHVAERVLAFHERLSPQAFIDFQQECRQFWQKWLCPEGFFEHFHHHLTYLDKLE